jgi:hypothetical protein
MATLVSQSLASKITDSIFTALANGNTGGTYSLDGTAVPNSGYFVGGAVPSLINPTRAQVLEFVETAGADYVGFWEDSETLALYIDAVDHTDSEAFARRLSEVRGEIAYWDVAKGDEIRISA